THPVVDPEAGRRSAPVEAAAGKGRRREEAMKDRVFSGVDVGDAVAIAAANLGLPKAELRYVVLEQGSPGGRGLGPTPARIAVLLGDRLGDTDDRPEADERAAERPPQGPAGPDPRTGLLETIRAVAEAGGAPPAPPPPGR